LLIKCEQGIREIKGDFNALLSRVHLLSKGSMQGLEFSTCPC
jgi:hypothetical protein